VSRGFRVARAEITLEIDLMCQMPTCFVGTSTTHGNDCNIRSTMIPPAQEGTSPRVTRSAFWLTMGLSAAARRVDARRQSLGRRRKLKDWSRDVAAPRVAERRRRASSREPVRVRMIRSVPATATAVITPAAAIMRGTAGVRYAAHCRVRQAAHSAARSTELRIGRHWHAAAAHRNCLSGRA
jgi:hypothetical protein